MKKSLLFALSLSAMLVACGGNEKQEPAVEAEVQEAGSVECVASGDVVFIDLDYMMATSALYAKEGKSLEDKMAAFQTKMTTSQESWAKKEQSLAAEYSKLEKDAAKLQEDYQKGLITTLNAQQKQQELQDKGAKIQSRVNNLQATMQSEAQTLQTEEQALAEEQMVLMNKFQDLTRRAIAEINADGRYKMILNAVSVVDADPTLNISDLVLKKVDEIYAADSADAE